MNPLEAEDQEVIRVVLFETCPPTNPAVLLKAAREWYLRFGDDEVLREILDWLCQVCGVRALDLENYEAAQRAFLEKTGVETGGLKGERGWRNQSG